MQDSNTTQAYDDADRNTFLLNIEYFNYHLITYGCLVQLAPPCTASFTSRKSVASAFLK